jgi:hypothetical protein
MAARRLAISRLLSPASTSMRVRSVAIKAELPELLLARIQTLTMVLLLLAASRRLFLFYTIQ